MKLPMSYIGQPMLHTRKDTEKKNLSISGVVAQGDWDLGPAMFLDKHIHGKSNKPKFSLKSTEYKIKIFWDLLNSLQQLHMEARLTGVNGRRHQLLLHIISAHHGLQLELFMHAHCSCEAHCHSSPTHPVPLMLYSYNLGFPSGMAWM